MLSKVPLQSTAGLTHTIPGGSEVTEPDPCPENVTVKVFWLNAALTYLDWLILTVQVGVVPVQAPPQPEKVSPVFAVAVSVTVVSFAYSAKHERPHEISSDNVVTFPGPVTATVNGNVAALTAPKTAVTSRAALIATVHVLLSPEQAPPHPMNWNPEFGVAERLTIVPDIYESEQSPLPSIQLLMLFVPASTELTDPPPLTTTLRGYALSPVNDADTFFASVMETEQVVAVPQLAPAPPHEMKDCPVLGVAVSRMLVAGVVAATKMEQVLPPVPQLNPPELEVTSPSPVTVVVKAYFAVTDLDFAVTKKSLLYWGVPPK